MPLLRIQRYKSSSVTVVDYFVTVASYNAGGQAVSFQLDPSLVSTVGNYAVIRTTGTISGLASPIGTSSWTSTHPTGWLVSAPKLSISLIGGVQYNILYVEVSA